MPEFLFERLYFGLVASLLPIDTPNRHRGGGKRVVHQWVKEDARSAVSRATKIWVRNEFI
jgi:hypothetical protein